MIDTTILLLLQQKQLVVLVSICERVLQQPSESIMSKLTRVARKRRPRLRLRRLLLRRPREPKRMIDIYAMSAGGCCPYWFEANVCVRVSLEENLPVVVCADKNFLSTVDQL